MLQRANVSRIYLVHGTFAGTDMTGLVGQIARVLPGVARRLREQEKLIVDALVGDRANYTHGFARQLEAAVNQPGGRTVSVSRFHWTGENHHLGRVDAAIRLIDELITNDLRPGERVLIWGHSHAGNVFAVMTNLWGGSMRCRERFFRAARSLLADSAQRPGDLVWKHVRDVLLTPDPPLPRIHLDLVTFGMPVRYGWETRGYANLLHFVNHRPTPGLAEYRVPFPASWEQVVNGASGDFFQQFFIAGTNLPTNVFPLRSWMAETRLQRLLQAGLTRSRLWDRLKHGTRVSAEGTTLLVDYAYADPEASRFLGGHAVYTMREWMAFHLGLVAKRFYATTDGAHDASH